MSGRSVFEQSQICGKAQRHIWPKIYERVSSTDELPVPTGVSPVDHPIKKEEIPRLGLELTYELERDVNHH